MTWYEIVDDGVMNDGDLFKGEVNGKEVLIIKDAGKYFATSSHCTHEDYDLSEGFMDDGDLICPNHFATFNPADGTVKSPPEGSGDISPLESYKVKVENGKVLVETS